MQVRRDPGTGQGRTWEPTTLKRVSPVPIALLSLLIVMIVWIWVLLFGEETMKTFMAMSAKFRMVDLRSTRIVFVLMFLSVLAVSLWSYFLAMKKKLFLVLLISSFVFSEVLLRGFNEIAFVIRYVSITVLLSLGMAQFAEHLRERMDTVQVLGLAYLVWSFINLMINGFDLTSLAMLPMQLTIVLGLFLGFGSIFGDSRSIRYICTALALLGVFMTFFHICSFGLVPKPFLGGRFRSAFIFPTNFANAYVLLFVSMVWYAIRYRSLLIKTALWCLVVIGFSLLFLSGTRNSLLVIVVTLPVFAMVWKMKVPFVAALAVLAVGVIAYVFLRDSGTVSVLGERLVKFSAKTRLEVWKISWEYIKARPFVGYGLGKELDVLAGSMPKWGVLNPHNAYLGIWMQSGLIGLCLMLAIYFVAMFRGIRTLMDGRIAKDVKEVVVLPVALLIGLFVAGFFEENLSSRSSLQQLIWGISICMVMCLRKTIGKERTETS